MRPFSQHKGTTRESETRRNNIDTAMDFYVRELNRADTPRSVWLQYLDTATRLIEAVPRHPRYQEYRVLLGSYKSI